MGYLNDKMMDRQTTLYSLIGTDVLSAGLEMEFNEKFKEIDINSKILPLNIREDDIGFFLNGFKDSQMKAAYFTKEYWTVLPELLVDMSDEVKACGIADIVSVKNAHNIAEVVYGKAVTSLIKKMLDLENSTISFSNHLPTSLSILYNLEREKTGQMSLLHKESDIMIGEDIVIKGRKIEYEQILKEIADIKTKEWANV